MPCTSISGDGPARFQHHLVRFLRQAVDDMRAYANAARAQPSHRIPVTGRVMRPVDEREVDS